jgi:hypothetical protein
MLRFPPQLTSLERSPLPVTLRLRDVPRDLELRFRDAVETALEGDWCLTVSQSHLDGQWHLQLEGTVQRCHAVLPTITETAHLEGLLRQLATPGTRPHHGNGRSEDL